MRAWTLAATSMNYHRPWTLACGWKGQHRLRLSCRATNSIFTDCPETKLVDAIPKEYRTITPYLLVTGVPALLEFLQKAFDAAVLKTEVRDDGSIMHAEVRVGNSMLMAGEASADFIPMPASIYLYVEHCDAVYQRALNAGASIVFPISDLPSGERYGGVRDASGNVWWIATHVEDVSDDEQRKRWATFKR